MNFHRRLIRSLFCALMILYSQRPAAAFLRCSPRRLPTTHCLTRWQSHSAASEGSPDKPANRQSIDSLDEMLTPYQNKNNIRDQVFSAISKDGGIKVTAATVRNLVNDMMIQHTLTPVCADGLGRTITCALLMANGIQDEQVVQITMNGELPTVHKACKKRILGRIYY